MDCEGSEGAIMTSIPNKYLRNVKKISMEFHDNVSTLNHHQIQALLHEAGFST